jgi:hypothetical protein
MEEVSVTPLLGDKDLCSRHSFDAQDFLSFLEEVCMPFLRDFGLATMQMMQEEMQNADDDSKKTSGEMRIGEELGRTKRQNKKNVLIQTDFFLAHFE